jgi:RNA polymerase sigma factor (sigma-70 family)
MKFPKDLPPELAEEYAKVYGAKQGDNDSYRWLLEQHSGLIHKMAHRARRSGHCYDDAISLCHEALMMSVRKFDFRKRVRFVTYLYWAMDRMSRKAMNNGPIRIPEHAPTTESCVAFANPRFSRSDKLIRHIEDEQDDAERWPELTTITHHLPERERKVLHGRAHGETLRVLGERLGISGERVRQLEEKAIETLQEQCVS